MRPPAGTGLTNGDQVGRAGKNGAASGWEMDWSENATAADGVVVTASEGSDRGKRRQPSPGTGRLHRESPTLVRDMRVRGSRADLKRALAVPHG